MRLIDKLNVIVAAALLALVITFLAFGSAHAQFTVNPSQQFQVMDGFGTITEGMGDVPQSTINAAFSLYPAGIGLTFDRISMNPSGQPQGPYPLNSDGTFQDGDWVNAQRVQAAGGKVWSGSNGAPAAWKSPATLANGELQAGHFQDYANLISSFITTAANNGVNLYGFSVTNEPDQANSTVESMQLTSSDMDAVIKVVKPTLSAAHPGVKLIAPETAESVTAWAYINVFDSTALADLDLYSQHGYGIGPQTPGNTLHSMWGTEWQGAQSGQDATISGGLDQANNIAAGLLKGETAWTPLFLGWPGAAGSRLMLLNSDWTINTLLPTYYTLGNFSAFVRPGYVRVGSSGSLSGVTLVPFVNPSNNAPVVVLINNNASAQNVTINGLNTSTLTPYITSGSQNLAPQSAVSVSGGNLSYTLPAVSVTTLAAASGTPPPPTSTPVPTPTAAPTPIAGVQPNGMPAPAGFQWVVSYDEEFTNESSINNNVWNLNNGASLSANGVALQGLPTDLTTGYMVNTNDSVTQRYGAWEWMAQFPHNDSGEGTGYHTDLYLADSGVQAQTVYIEDDICEWDTQFTPALACQNAINDTENGTNRGQQTFLTHVPNNGSGSPAIGDAFHTWGAYWANDGTAHGTISDWFDGVQQGNTIHTLTNARWDSGARPLIINHSCGTGACSSAANNPLLLKYFRIWKLAPVSAISTPTPTPVPSSTPTPAGCSINLSVVPPGQASVLSPVTFAPVVSGCAGWPSANGFVRVEQTSPSPMHFDGAAGTTSTSVSLANGNYTAYVTLWSNSVTQIGGASNSASFTVASSTPTPTPIPTASPTPTPTSTPTPSPTPTPTPTPTPSPSPSPSPTASPTPTPMPPTPTPTIAPTPTPLPPTPTPAPTASPTPAPTSTPTASATPTPIPLQGGTYQLQPGTDYNFYDSVPNCAGSPTATPTPIPTPVPTPVVAGIMRANDFLDIFGYTTHHGQGKITVAQIEQGLTYTGVRHIRDDGTNNPTLLTDYCNIHSATGATMIMLPFGGDLTGTQGFLDTLAQCGALMAVEGQNEANNQPFSYQNQSCNMAPGGSTFGCALFQKDLYTMVKGDKNLSALPVYQETEVGAEPQNYKLQFLSVPTGSNLLGVPDGTTYADYANIHPYDNCATNPPRDNDAWSMAAPVASDQGCYDGMHGEFTGAPTTVNGVTTADGTWRNKFPAYPITKDANGNITGTFIPRVTTESGQSTNQISQDLQGKVYTDVALDAAARGWTHWLQYQMGEEGDGMGAVYDASFNFKLEATYMHNLTTILADTSSAFTPVVPATSVSPQPATIHSLLLQKSNGKYELVVWGEAWTSLTKTLVTVTTGSSTGGNVYDITSGTAPISTFTGGTVTLNISDHAMIVEF